MAMTSKATSPASADPFAGIWSYSPPPQPTASPQTTVSAESLFDPLENEFGAFESAPKATAVVSAVLISPPSKAPSNGSAAAKAPAKDKEKEAELSPVQMAVWTQLMATNKCAAKAASMLVRKPINSDEDRIRRVGTFQGYGFTATEATAMVDKLFPPKVTAKK